MSAGESTYETLTFELDDDGVGTLWLDRPDALNSFTVTMAAELEDFFLGAAHRDEVRAVVVVDESERRGHRPVVALEGVAREGLPQKLPNGLAAGGERPVAHVLVERREQVGLERDGEAAEIGHGGYPEFHHKDTKLNTKNHEEGKRAESRTEAECWLSILAFSL